LSCFFFSLHKFVLNFFSHNFFLFFSFNFPFSFYLCAFLIFLLFSLLLFFHTLPINFLMVDNYEKGSKNVYVTEKRDKMSPRSRPIPYILSTFLSFHTCISIQLMCYLINKTRCIAFFYYTLCVFMTTVKVFPSKKRMDP